MAISRNKKEVEGILIKQAGLVRSDDWDVVRGNLNAPQVGTMFLGSQEISNGHIPGVTKPSVTQVLMMIALFNFEYLLTDVTACNCYVHIPVQPSICVQQKQSGNFLIAPLITLQARSS